MLWTGRRVFGVEIEYRPAGSGDTTWNYVQLFDFAMISVAVTLLWSFAAGVGKRLRRRQHLGYPYLHEWLRIYVRFYLAQMMIVHGAVKVIKLQFPIRGRLACFIPTASPLRCICSGRLWGLPTAITGSPGRVRCWRGFCFVPAELPSSAPWSRSV